MRPSLILLALLLPLPAAAQKKVDIRRAATPVVSVRLGGAFGAIRIIGWDRDSIALTGTLSPGSAMDGGPLRGTGPVTGMKFWVEAGDERSASGNRFELRVPARGRVWIKSGSAEIDASGVTGGLDLNIIGGSVRVSGSPRELLVESMDGSVTCTGSPEFARLKTATGDITLVGGGDDVALTTISGALRATDGTIQRGRFESVTGGILVSSDFARGAEARFDTHGGLVELRLDPRADLEIDASTVTGVIDNTFTTTRPIAGREGRGMEIGIMSGAARGRVTIRSFKGNIRLVRK